MMKGVNFKFSATNAAAPAMKSFQKGLQNIQNQTQQATRVNSSWMKGMSANRRTIQQMGFQVTDFAVQIGGGQSAMLAFVQQGGQMLQFFGATGAVLATLLTVFGTMAIIVMRSGKALSDLTPILGVLEHDFKTLASVIGSTKDTIIDAINLIINNLDVLMIAGGGAALFFGVKWVASMILASKAAAGLRAITLATAVSFQIGGAGAAAMTVATSALTAGLNLLRVALIRLGIPALVIAAAWLIQRFVALRQATGSWGAVLKLFGDLFKGVMAGMKAEVMALPTRLKAGWEAVKAGFYRLVLSMAKAWKDLMSSLAEASREAGWDSVAGIFDAGVIKVSEMEQTMGDLASASEEAGRMLSGAADAATDAGWQQAREALKAITDILGKDVDIDIRDWLGGGEKAAKGLAGKMKTLKETVAETRIELEALGILGVPALAQLDRMWEQFVQDMKTTNNPEVVINRFTAGLKDLQQQAKSLYSAVADPMEQMFMEFVDGTSSMKDAFKKMARAVILDLYRIYVVGNVVRKILGAFGISNPVTAAAPIAGALATGGPATGGRPYLVGEKGPEIVVPGRTSTVLPNGESLGGGGGVTVIQNNTFGSGVTKAEVNAMLPKLVETTKAAVFDAQRRSVNGVGYA